MTCRHHDGTKCTLGLYGGTPSPGVCSVCERYDGPPRGAGDVVHAALSVVGIPRIVKKVAKSCGCQERRAAMNSAIPFRIRGKS